jgi:hypothetical protein
MEESVVKAYKRISEVPITETLIGQIPESDWGSEEVSNWDITVGEVKNMEESEDEIEQQAKEDLYLFLKSLLMFIALCGLLFN